MASVILHFAFLIGIPFSTGASCVWSELLTRTTSTQGGVHGSVPRSQPTPRREYAGSRSGTLDFWIGLVRATVHGPSDMALPSTAGERHSRTSQEGFRRRSKRRRWRCPQGWLEPLLGGQASQPTPGITWGWRGTSPLRSPRRSVLRRSARADSPWAIALQPSWPCRSKKASVPAGSRRLSEIAAISSASFPSPPDSRVHLPAQLFLLFMECRGRAECSWACSYVPRTPSQAPVAPTRVMGDQATGLGARTRYLAHGAPNRPPRTGPPIEAWYDRRRNPACVLSFELRLRRPAWVVDGCAVGGGLSHARLRPSLRVVLPPKSPEELVGSGR